MDGDMAEQYTVSVIVPIYNTRQYLRACLESLRQEAGFPQYEILLVDDGSTDGSAEIIREYTARYPNIFAVARGDPPRNCGLAAARNEGLRHARGQYVFFLDSDDVVREQYISRLYAKIVQSQCDIVYAGYSRWAGKEITPVERPVLADEHIMTGCDFLGRRMDRRDDHNFVWCALYRTELFKARGVAFEDRIRLYEDLPFTLLAASAARRVCALPLYDYLYRQRSGSLVQDGVRLRDAESTLTVLELMFGDARYQTDPVYLRYGYQVISMCLCYLGVLDREKRVSPDQRRQLLRRLRAAIPWKAMYRAAAQPRERVKWWMWRIDPLWFARIVQKKTGRNGEKHERQNAAIGHGDHAGL